MDEKTTPNSSGSPEKKPEEVKSPPTPINSFSPPPDPIKFGSPFSPSSEPAKTESGPKIPMDNLSKPEPVKDIGTKLDSIKSDTAPIEKKSNTLLFVLVAVILVIASAIITGVIVYSMQSSQISPLQKDKAQLQSQVSNLQSKVDTLQKEKTQLESDLEAAKTPATPTASPETPANPPAPSTTPETPPTPTPTPVPVPAPTPGQ